MTTISLLTPATESVTVSVFLTKQSSESVIAKAKYLKGVNIWQLVIVMFGLLKKKGTELT